MSKTPMDNEAAAVIQSAADRYPDSDFAQSGFSELGDGPPVGVVQLIGRTSSADRGP